MSVFDILKTQKEALDRQAQNLRRKPTDIFIRLDFDQKGAFIQTIDKTGKETLIDPNLFSGATRHLIQSVNAISDKNAFLIDWENPGSRLYLHDYPHLIAPLMSSGLLVNNGLRPVKTDSREQNMGNTDQPAILKLRLQPHTPAEKIVSKDSNANKRNTAPRFIYVPLHAK
ncbi:hypothetical protein [Arachidicoccus terrestris]|uniref:hypothetical protein n=1 Tax=Arachidicoccus terrestris TaxID=2875539 RepID=UPI001CC3E994|nr:hypothetical protein [Arachidicoccus terrestris]UAY55345.1 hypothetical protein K9M52_18385 [Arachidicoccus terrestris]